MKIVLVSNYLNHHQTAFCEEMIKLIGNEFKFISTEPMEEERLKLGWKQEEYQYEIKAHLNDEMFEYAMDVTYNADVVIIGAGPNKFIEPRLKDNKLTFRYTERVYKQGFKLKDIHRYLNRSRINFLRFQFKPFYILCASAYTAKDISLLAYYKNRYFKWGYFPKFVDYDIEELLNKKPIEKITILWCGRFIDWKHPEIPIYLAQRLKNDNIDFKLQMLGTGVMFEEIKGKASDNNLNEYVEFKGPLSPEAVREEMEKANIFISTSDFNEGWGVVLNEAMNSGCAVVASHALGASPFLIKDNVNGFMYKDGDLDDLYKKLLMLINNEELRLKFSKNAYHTIASTWNPRVAAERFYTFASHMLKGEKIIYQDGPCSKAELLKNNWYK